jgi:hypothetical protein
LIERQFAIIGSGFFVVFNGVVRWMLKHSDRPNTGLSRSGFNLLTIDANPGTKRDCHAYAAI